MIQYNPISQSPMYVMFTFMSRLFIVSLLVVVS